MKNCLLYNYCVEFHKDRKAGFICFNPPHCLNHMCEFFKGSRDRVKPQGIHIDPIDMEQQMRETRDKRKEDKKRLRKKYKNNERAS